MKILCPTDFSPHSKVAVEYAANLCNDLKAELYLVSAYQVPENAATFVNLDFIMSQKNTDKMEQLIAEILPIIQNGMHPVTEVISGEASSTILNYADKKAIDLIIMGTQGTNSISSLFFGSTTKQVAQECKIPVLAIPQEIAHRLTSNKMLLALDNKALENENSFKIPLLISKSLGLKIDIIHISKDDREFPFDPFIGAYMGDSLGEVILKSGKDPVQEIKLYAESHNIGMLIMIRRNKGFFQKLLTVGNTSEELEKTNIPLLILID